MKSKKKLTPLHLRDHRLPGLAPVHLPGRGAFMRYFSDKQCGGPRKALKVAEGKLVQLKELLDKAPRRNNKLTKTAEAKARKMLKAG